MISNKQLMSNQKIGEMEPLWSNIGSQKPLLPTKRKAATERLPSSILPGVDKRVAQMEPHANSPRLSQTKKHIQRVQTPKSSTAPQEVSPKVQSGSFEAVRSKMRESLASALSVGSQNQEKTLSEDNSYPVEAGTPQTHAHATPQPVVDIIKKTSEPKNIENSHRSDGKEPQYNYVMPDADGSFGDAFFVKDELLQGNGLSWAWDMEVSELKEPQINEKTNMDVGRSGAAEGQSGDITKLGNTDVNANGTGHTVNSPQELASEIEAELFKLFGGVNKKYKEKGRSLMFNLKDRNNPELREKVLSGVISPEGLCLMTPEELASKELSEWRMAKAEELDKMIVLQDSDVDIRRLVKKTHKGEYQVEVEQDDSVSVEVSVGTSSFTQFPPKKKKTEYPSSEAYEKEAVDGDKSSLENLTIPADGTDFMQELIVEEFKDEGFLPPIVSLDEFMESLDSEPPFENMPIDSKEIKPHADKCASETVGRSGSDKLFSASADAVTYEAAGTSDQLKSKTTEALPNMKSSENSVERKPMVMGEHVWEGELQLTVSSSVSVIGLFRSGEKTSTKEWASSMEIKGRVRLDAFEKFLHELPMSRSRAVMVVHFVLKDSSSEIHRAILSEAVDSYVGDERLGYGEPIPGVELYFCPPQTRVIEMLRTHLSKDQTNTLNSADNGLIGIVVWRRPHITTTLAYSPTSSQHKHHKTHNIPLRRHENINANTNSNFIPKSNVDLNPSNPNNDEDDDIPPGFGPGASVAARDEDDLPEFNFSGNSNPLGQKIAARVTQPNVSRPVDQIRQLIHRYGQPASAGDASKSRNQDIDDDMPEWRPQLNQHQVRPHMVSQVRPDMVNQARPHNMNMQPPVNVVRWVASSPVPHILLPNAASVQGKHYGEQWRRDAPRSRGF